MEREHRLAVVIGPEHVTKIGTLAADCPVWAVRTPESEAIAAALWDDGLNLTLFNAGEHPEQTIYGVLEEIELHQGEPSGFPPISRIDVFGAEPSDALRRHFCSLGFTDLVPLAGGFMARREML